VTLPKIIAPDFSSIPLTIFELSGSQLILPLPEDTLGYGESAPNKIDLYDDSKVFVGNPTVNRQIELLSSTWDYIIESSSLIAGRAYLDALVYTAHHRTGLNTSSIMDDKILKKWIYFNLNEFYEKEKEKLIEYARHDGDDYREDFNGEGMDLENCFTHPNSEKELNTYIENNTPKSSFQQGITAQKKKPTSLPKITQKNFSAMCVSITTQS